jgi:hypothetical protein
MSPLYKPLRASDDGEALKPSARNGFLHLRAHMGLCFAVTPPPHHCVVLPMNRCQDFHVLVSMEHLPTEIFRSKASFGTTSPDADSLHS